jgi:hypothetical protein
VLSNDVAVGLCRARLGFGSIDGPVCFDGTITSESYVRLILATILHQLKKTNITEGRFMEDSATAHTADDCRNALAEVLSERAANIKDYGLPVHRFIFVCILLT